MGQRREGREHALKLLYQEDPYLNERQVRPNALALYLSNFEDALDSDVADFAERLLTGVSHAVTDVDRRIEEASHNWRLNRMSRIDRNILRLAVFELLYCEDVPSAVVADEAIELAKTFGGQESSKFVNGVLTHIIALRT